MIAMLKMKLEELTGWEVIVGVKDSSALPKYLKELQADSRAHGVIECSAIALTALNAAESPGSSNRDFPSKAYSPN